MKKLNLRTAKLGGYSIVYTVIVLAIVIIVNLAVNALPSSYSKISTSDVGIYDISDASKNIVSGLKDNITIYLLVEAGYEDTILEEYVSRYCDLSTKLSYKSIDPAIQPGFAATYTDEKFSSWVTNIIVVNNSNNNSKFIPNESIYYSQYSDYEMQMYQMYYGYTPENPTYFDIEQQLTSAIDYVTADHLPKIAYTQGHGETEFVSSSDQTIATLLENENITLSPLADLTKEKSLDEIDLLIINAPSKDFTAEEISVVRSFTDAGGHVILNSFYDVQAESRDLPNLYAFMKERGLEYADKLVFEENEDYYYGYYGPLYIYANLADNSFSASIQSGTQVMMSYCHAINLSNEEIENITLSKLMTTTTKGYAKNKIDQNTKVDKAEGDEEGQFVLAAMSEKKLDDGSSKVFWFASDDIINAGTLSYYSNVSYLINVITDTCGKGSSVNIDAKSFQIEALAISQSASNLWGTILTLMVPAAFLVLGFLYWRRRTRA